MNNEIMNLTNFKIPKLKTVGLVENYPHENLSECVIPSSKSRSNVIKKMGRISKKLSTTDFGSLKMMKMEPYEIPEEIENSEAQPDTGKKLVGKYKTCLEKMRSDVDEYINGSKIMLWMEEAASAKDAREFDMNEVQLLQDLSSDSANSYKINYVVRIIVLYIIIIDNYSSFFSL